MTLYLLFERLDAGKFTLDTPLKVSEHAADQAPTKLDLKPGQTIPVEDAIRAWSRDPPMTPRWSSPKASAAARTSSPS